MYLPGEEVSGSVVLELSRPKKLLAVQISFIGSFDILSDSFSAKKKFHKDSTTLWSDEESEEDGMLPAGQHTLPFSIQIPEHAPPSLESEDDSGRIKYRFYAKIKWGKYQSDTVVEKRVRIVSLVNTKESHLQTPVHEIYKSERSVIFPSNSAQMNVELPRTGFKLEDTVPITVDVHSAGRKVKLSACLVRRAISALHGARTVDKNKIAQVVAKSCKPAPGGSTVLWNPDLTVPTTDPTLKSDCINIEYFVLVTAKPQWGQKLTVEIPVTIGNIAV